MADMEINNKKDRHKIKTAGKRPVRVDLTPMVDLGFLLITFFVFTTTMAKATVMKVDIPYETTANDPVCNSCVLTVLLGKREAIHYYEGAFETASLYSASYDTIRDIIQEKKKAVQQVRGNAGAFVLIIKAADSSSFKNFVDITDEVTINSIKRYYIDELTASEIKKMEQGASQ